MMEFMRELQWQCYNKHQLSCYNLDDVLVYKYGVETQPKPDETPLVYFGSFYANKLKGTVDSNQPYLFLFS